MKPYLLKSLTGWVIVPAFDRVHAGMIAARMGISPVAIELAIWSQSSSALFAARCKLLKQADTDLGRVTYHYQHDGQTYFRTHLDTGKVQYWTGDTWQCIAMYGPLADEFIGRVA